MSDCLESQVRDKLKVDPRVAKAFWDETLGLIDKLKDPVKAIQAVADKHGFQPETVSKILNSDRRLVAATRDMMLKRQRAADLRRAAEMFVDHSDKGLTRKGVEFLWNGSRKLATVGHGGVFPFTHARNLIFAGKTEARFFAQAVKEAYSYADVGLGKFKTKAGEARWIRDMRDLQLRSSYKAASQLGLDVKIDSEPTGILTKGMKGWGKRGFDSLKTLRLNLWDHYSKQIPDELRTEDGGRALAASINEMTGGLERGSLAERIASKTSGISFAPKLFLARRLEAALPLRALAKSGSMTAAERAVRNIALTRWAKITGVSFGLLAANDQFNKYFGDNKHRVNFFDFSKPGSLWRANINGIIIPISPLVEVARAPFAIGGALLATKQQLRGDKPSDSAIKIAGRELLNAAHPSIIKGIELATGREQFGVPGKERRLPFKGVAQMVRGEEKKKPGEVPMSGMEYALEQGPIPLSAGTRDYYQALQDQGAQPRQAAAIVHALRQAALSGGAGLHAHPESKPKH